MLSENTNRGHHPPTPDNSRCPSSTSDDQRSIPPDRRTILSQWRKLKRLKPIDPQKLAPLVDNKANRNVAMNFTGEDAAVVMYTIDKVLKKIEDPEKTRLHAFKMLRHLAGKTRQVPKSYLVSRWTRYTVTENLLGRGTFADVKEGKLGKKVVAVKVICISRKTDVEEIHRRFCKECVLWMNISHPNILQLIAVEIKPRANKFSMICEMMVNGNIMDYIHTKRANRFALLRDVASGLRHLHKLGVVHGDLKGPNILINNKTPPQACIADFGLGTIAPWMSFDPTTNKGAGGTPGFMAPELNYDGARHTKEADMYAFGMVIYQVILGIRSFGQHRVVELTMLAASGSRPERPEGPMTDNFGEGTWEFAEKCWNKDPKQRPTVEEALEHFERLAAVSTLVDPSPMSPALAGADGSFPSNSSRSFSKLLSQPPLSGSRKFRQTTFAAQAFVNPGSVRSPIAIPPIVEEKSDLLDRVRRRLKTLKLLPSSL